MDTLCVQQLWRMVRLFTPAAQANRVAKRTAQSAEKTGCRTDNIARNLRWVGKTMTIVGESGASVPAS